MCSDQEKTQNYRFRFKQLGEQYEIGKAITLMKSRYKVHSDLPRLKSRNDIPTDAEIPNEMKESPSELEAKTKYEDLMNRSKNEIPIFEFDNSNVCKACGSKSNKE